MVRKWIWHQSINTVKESSKVGYKSPVYVQRATCNMSSYKVGFIFIWYEFGSEGRRTQHDYFVTSHRHTAAFL